MEPYAPFLNKAGRLRSGWRLGIYLLAFVASLFIFGSLVRLAYVVAERLHLTIGSVFTDVVFRLVMLGSALLAGWVCNRWLEGLPWRALGLAFHSGWFRDLLIGSLVGGGSLAIAALVGFAGGGLRFSFSGKGILLSVFHSLGMTAALFIVAALAEEAAFRGYALQTLTRAGLAWLGVLITSVPFALGHLQNPNVVAGFTFINTALAGVWLAMAYLKTRSLWFPLGVHWAWNWALGSVFGLPVSGLKLSAFPVLQAFDRGPAWLTGGSYGIEGGLAGTVALLISTLFIWRTGLVAATPELKKLTSEENPVKPNQPSESV
jgi:membrane protease YdiL (CAAX protease family)